MEEGIPAQKVTTKRHHHRWLTLLLGLCLFSSLPYWLVYMDGQESVSAGIAHIRHHLQMNFTFLRRPQNTTIELTPGNMANLSRIPGANEKLLLLYNPWYGSADWGANFSICEYKCRATTDRNLLNRSDAVLFDPLNLHRGDIRIPERGPDLHDQIRVVTIVESPGVFTTKFNMDMYDNQFNWTMTYRRDSDIPALARRFIHLMPNDSKAHFMPTVDSIKHKKLVAAMITRCNAESGRDAYIAKFKEFAPLDYYGGCGNLNCSKEQNCYPVLAPKYKFWFSFEGALCKDYITEKFYEPLLNGMVPVVFGYGSYSEVAPKGSYIDVMDFETPAALAKYLLHLDKHDEEYLKYFSWMKEYKIPSIVEDPELVFNFFCTLCRKLQNITDLQKNRKWYPSFENWYRKNNTNLSMCIGSPSLTAMNLHRKSST